jgi:pimeloyl-ACP methyl ester carboxylesterase
MPGSERVADDGRLPQLPGVEHRYVELDGLRVHVAEAGSAGPTLILLHGWPQHWWCWRHVIPLLDGFRLIMPDLRGFGWSSAPAGGYDKECLATDLLNLMDAERIDTAGLIAHDWGGWVGFLACLREPRRFTGLLALGITHPFATLSVRSLLQSWRLGYQPLISSPLVGRALLTHSPRVLAGMLSQAGVGSVDDARRYADVVAQPERAAASVALYRTFLLHELAQVGRYRSQFLDVPTRLVVGSGDPVIVPAFLDGWEPYAGDMVVKTLAGVGHFVPEEAPREVAAEARALFGPVRGAHAAAAAGGDVIGRAPDGLPLVEGPNSS